MQTYLWVINELGGRVFVLKRKRNKVKVATEIKDKHINLKNA